MVLKIIRAFIKYALMHLSGPLGAHVCLLVSHPNHNFPVNTITLSAGIYGNSI